MLHTTLIFTLFFNIFVYNHKNCSLWHKSAKFSAVVNFEMLFHLKAGHMSLDNYFSHHLEYQNGCHNFHTSIFKSYVA